MTEITDEYMNNMLVKTRPYSIIILKDGPNRKSDNAQAVVWEHGRRNFKLRKEGLLSIVCPVPGGEGVSGIGIFKTSVEETKKIMDEDPAVKAGVFVYETYSCLSFPGDCLPV